MRCWQVAIVVGLFLSEIQANCQFYCNRAQKLRCNTFASCGDEQCIIDTEMRYKLIVQMLLEGDDHCECDKETDVGECENLQGANFHIFGRPGFDPHRRRPSWNFHYNQSKVVTLAKHEYGCHQYIKPLLLYKQIMSKNPDASLPLEKFLMLESATSSEALFYVYLGRNPNAISQATSDLKDFLILNDVITGSRIFDMILMNFNNTVQDLVRFCSCIHTKTCDAAYICPKFKLYWWHLKINGPKSQLQHDSKRRVRRGGCTNPLSIPGYDSVKT